MEKLIIIALVIILLVIWIESTRKKMNTMIDNVNNALNQIAIQISLYNEVIITLCNLTKEYDNGEIQNIADFISDQSKIGKEKICLDEIIRKNNIILQIKKEIYTFTKENSKLHKNNEYNKYLNILDNYETMIQTSILIYNDSVIRLNKTLRFLPTRFLGHLLGMKRYTCLESTN